MLRSMPSWMRCDRSPAVSSWRGREVVDFSSCWRAPNGSTSYGNSCADTPSPQAALFTIGKSRAKACVSSGVSGTYRMRLTVLVITLNAEKKLARILPELVTVGDELVVGVDDSTTDSSAEIARRFTNKV